LDLFLPDDYSVIVVTTRAVMTVHLIESIPEVADGLDTRQLIDAGRLLERRHGKSHRVLGILEPLQVQPAELRRELGVPGGEGRNDNGDRDNQGRVQLIGAA
jgi:hypothetical protein